MKKKNKLSFTDILAVSVCVIYAAAGISISLNRFWQYESGYYDFGIFDRAIWLASKFKPPVIDHFVVPGKIIFADHFNPSIFLFSPIYWFTSKSEAILMVQAIVVAGSGFILFFIGKRILKNSLIVLMVVTAYFLYTGLQNAVLYDFHEVTAMTLFLMLAYWAIFNGRKKLFFLFFAITLGFKESLALLGVGLAVFIFFYKKDWRKISIIVLALSLIWGYIAAKIIIPHFSGGFYYYAQQLPMNTGDFISQLYTPFIKIKTVYLTLLSFLCLPLMSPPSIFIILTNFVNRFLTDAPTRWDLGLHYNAEIAPTLGIATLLALNLIKSKLGQTVVHIAAFLLLTISFIMYRFILHGPFMLATHPAFYNHTKNFQFLDKMMTVVPSNVTVAAQNNLASRLLHEKEIWMLSENYRKHNPEYILMDVRPGQNGHNFMGIKGDPNLLLEDIKNNGAYRLIYHEGDQYVFKR